MSKTNPIPSPANATSALDLHELLRVLQSVKQGDVSRRMPVGVSGIGGEIAAAINGHIDQMIGLSVAQNHVCKQMATGTLGGQVDVDGLSGIWADVRDHFNFSTRTISSQVQAIHAAVEALAEGNFSSEMQYSGLGEMRELRDCYNRMLASLRDLHAEVRRACQDITVRGWLGPQASVPTATGRWADMVGDLNELCAYTTNYLRNAGYVITSIASGEARGRMSVEATSELAELKAVINDLAERVAREGKLVPST